MRRIILVIVAMAFCVLSASAQTAEELIAKYIKTVGGMEKIQAVKSLRRTGKFIGGGGFEAGLVEENKRPNQVRQELTMQGMTGVSAYDGKAGWKIEPWGGKKDPEALSEEELRSLIADADFDSPLVNYQQKGYRVEYVGMDEVEGTDTYKLKVTLNSGDVRHYYLDTDYYVPIKIETKRIIRGTEREFETILGDYKEVNGWYLYHSAESALKGSQFKSKVVYDKIEANVTLADNRFQMPEQKPTKSDEKK